MSFLLNPFVFAAAGDFEAIASTTVGSGGASSIEFTSIPGTYQHLQIRGLLKDNGTSPPRVMPIQLGNGTLVTSGYAWHSLHGDGSSAGATGGSSATTILSVNQVMFNTANIFSAFVIDILDYSSTSKNTTLRYFGGFDSNGAGLAAVVSGLMTSTSAVDRIKLGTRGNFSGTLAQHSTLALYGIKA